MQILSEHNYTVLFFKVHYIISLNTLSCAFTPLWPFVCLGLLFLFFWFSGKKFVCPPPHFSAPSYATGTFSAHKAKAQVHFCDHAQSVVLINPSSVPPSFWESFLLSSVKNLHFDFSSRTAWWIFVNLGRDEVLMAPLKVLLFFFGHIRPGVNPGVNKNRSQRGNIFDFEITQLHTLCISYVEDMQ